MAQAELVEYEGFEYRHFDEKPLTLDEAVKQAKQLRAAEHDSFHRIVPIDAEMTCFRVESLPKSALYADMVVRWATLLNRFAFRFMHR